MGCNTELSARDFKKLLVKKIKREGRVSVADRKIFKAEAEAEYKRLLAKKAEPIVNSDTLGNKLDKSISKVKYDIGINHHNIASNFIVELKAVGTLDEYVRYLNSKYTNLVHHYGPEFDKYDKSKVRTEEKDLGHTLNFSGKSYSKHWEEYRKNEEKNLKENSPSHIRNEIEKHKTYLKDSDADIEWLTDHIKDLKAKLKHSREFSPINEMKDNVFAVIIDNPIITSNAEYAFNEGINSDNDSILEVKDGNVVQGTLFTENYIRLGSKEDIEQFSKWKVSMRDTLGSKLDKELNLEELDEYLFQTDPTKSKFENIEHEMILLDKKRQGVNFDEAHSKHLSSVLKGISNAMEEMAGLDIKVTKQVVDNAVTGQYNPSNKTLTVAVEDSLGAEFRNEFTQSHQEVYVHEAIHAILEYAYENGGTAVQDELAQIRRLWEKAGRELDYTSLLPKGEESYSKEAIQEAKDKYKYIFESRNPKEFTAHLMTNKEFADALETVDSRDVKSKVKDESFLDKIKRIFTNLLNKVLGRVRDGGSKSARSASVRLIYKLAKAEENAAKEVASNARPVTSSDGLKLYTKILDRGDKKFGKLSENLIGIIVGESKRQGKEMTVKDFKEMHEEAHKLMKEVKGLSKRNPFMKAYILIKSLPKLRALDKDVPALARVTDGMLTAIGLREDTNIREIIDDFLAKDSIYNAMTDAILKSTKDIDEVRQAVYEGVKDDVHGWFKNVNLRKKSNFRFDRALSTVILRADVQALNMKAKDVVDLFDGYKLDKEISKLEVEFKKEDLRDVDNLARYLATGEGLITNAEVIGRTIIDPNGMDKNYIEIVDKLATLKALKLTDAEAKADLKELVELDEEAVDKFIKYSRGLQQNNKKRERYVKGFIKETFDHDSNILVRPTADKKKMLGKGYKLVKVVEKVKGDVSNVEMGMYVSKYGAVARRVNGAINIQDEDKYGRTIRDRILEEGIEDPKEIKEEFKNRLKAFSDEYFKHDKDFPLSPVFSKSGKIVDFIQPMSRADKIKYLKMEDKGTENIARSHGHIGLAEKARQRNLELLYMIKEDYDRNAAVNPEKYEFIKPMQGFEHRKDLIPSQQAAHDQAFKNAELYALLPQGTKEDIRNIFGEKGLRVRRDLIRPLMGYREASLSDLFKTEKIITEKGKSNIRIIEKYWQDLMQIAKGNIVIKTPEVIMDNIVSNVKLLFLSGVGPLAALRMMVQAGEQLKQYEKDNKELDRLKRERDGGISNKSARIAQLEEAISNNKVTPLVDAGLYQSVIEDVENTTDSNRVSNLSNANLDKWLDPESKVGVPFNTAVNYLFMTKKTAPYRAMMKTTQVMDFYGRYVQYYSAIEDKGHTPAVAMRDAIDNFVNYEAPMNKWIHYLDKMGPAFFITYTAKIQRVIIKMAKKHPVRSVFDIGSQHFITDDTSDIWDMDLLLDKDITNTINPFRIPGHIGEVMYPSGLQFIEDIL